MVVYQFVKSQKGKEKLAYKGHIYRHLSSVKYSHYFRCEEKLCKGTATLRDVPKFNSFGGSITEGQAHSHTPRNGRLERLKVVEEIKSRARESTSAPASIVRQVGQTLNASIAMEMMSTSAIRQLVRRARKRDIPFLPEHDTDLIIPNEMRFFTEASTPIIKEEPPTLSSVNHSDSSSSSLTTGKTPSLKHWKDKEVSEWLAKNKLQKLKAWFKDFDGQLLNEYAIMAQDAPESFYSNLFRHNIQIKEALSVRRALRELSKI